MIATGTFSHSRNLGEFLATPDTGADVTIMGRIQFDLLGFTSDQLEAPLGQEVIAANGQPLDCLGTCNLIFHLGSRSVADRVTVVDSVDGILLAWYVARDLGILPDDYPTPLPLCAKAVHSQVSDTSWDWSNGIDQATPTQHAHAHEQLLAEFADVLRDPADFTDEDVLPPMRGPAMTIHLTDDAQPFSRVQLVRCPTPGAPTAPLSFSEWCSKASSRRSPRMNLLTGSTPSRSHPSHLVNCVPAVIFAASTSS